MRVVVLKNKKFLFVTQYIRNVVIFFIWLMIGGVDYNSILGWNTLELQITIPSSNGTAGFEKCFPISTVLDLLVERDETFMLELESRDSSIIFSPNTTTVTIEDNDGNE